MSEARTFGGAVAGQYPASVTQTPQQAQVRAAIARAADATGVDFQYLMAQAQLESGLDPSARAGTSSAAGLYQFTSGTWLGTLDRHGASHGLSWVSDAIEQGRIGDPSLRSQILGLRYDANASALMAAELARDNRAELTDVLGREPDAGELYLAHFLGSGGARDFLSALATNPDQSAALLLPRAAAANREVFYSRDGNARSVAGVMEFVRARMASAMGTASDAPFLPYDGAIFAAGDTTMPGAGALLAARLGASGDVPQGPVAREFGAARASALGSGAPPRVQGASGRSMADTLKGAFGSSEAALPGNVRDAYGKLARFGL